MHKNKAFTLIELMVVVAIISILSAIVLGNLTQAKAKARDSKRVSDLAQIQLALEVFFDRCNAYPTALDVTKNCSADGATVKLSDYISVIPTAPAPGNYDYASSGTDYVLKATLETNSPVLIDVNRSAGFQGVDCTTPLAYCVQPR